jgi:hypothetical protein
MRFLRVKGLNAKDIHKEIFPVYGGKCLSRKVVDNWVEKFSQGLSKVADDAQPGGEVAETTAKDFYAAGFDALIMRWDNCIIVGGGYVEKYVFFSKFEYHIFYFIYLFVFYLRTRLLFYLVWVRPTDLLRYSIY